MYQNGFNRISLYHGPLHEKIYHDPLAHQYLSPDVDLKKRIVSRCYVFAIKTNDDSSLKITSSYAKTIMLNRKITSLVNDRIKKMCGQRDGVLYESNYFSVK